jgi:hypothetical protein
MNKRLIVLLAGTMLWLVSTSASAVLLFSDNFDADVTGLNAPGGLINWTIDNGTVDVISSGQYGISCVGGTGKCLDMDGTSNNGGRIVSKAVFSLLAGSTYTLNFDVSGNQRNTSTDTWIMELLDPTTLTSIFGTSGAVAGTDPFTTLTTSVTFSGPTDVRLSFSDPGNDNVGYILDNVAFSCTGGQCASVPEPGMLALLSTGLLAIGVTRRRR